MIRSTGRFLMILLAACLTALALYWFVQANSTSLGMNALPGEGERREFNGGAPEGQALLEGVDESDLRRRDRDFDGGASIIPGLAGVLRTIVVFAVITMAVNGIKRLSGRFSRRRRPQPV